MGPTYIIYIAESIAKPTENPMITAYSHKTNPESQLIDEQNIALINEAVWLDLINPSPNEEEMLEKILELNIPTRDEMREIELSSRLYKNNDTFFMTATMIAQSDSLDPTQDAVTFVLTKQKLITIRYIEPQAFTSFIANLSNLNVSPTQLLIELLEATVDRLADILEAVSHRLDSQSKTIFQTASTNQIDYKAFMQKIGLNADLNSKIGESLLTFNRLITFFAQSEESNTKNHKNPLQISTLAKDISALSDHANFLSNKVAFLLDATLGMINIEQNAIIKIFSVAAVIFLPPTLIASIYGMNFHNMPELSWKYGYSFAGILMIFASWLPYKYFKYRKWL
jgi:magnesium transporter